MKWRNLPRQPFVGLAISAGAAILLADFFPGLFVASIVTVIAALIALRWSNSPTIYLLAAHAFFDRNIMLFRQDEAGAVSLKFFQHSWTATGFINHETFRSDSR